MESSGAHTTDDQYDGVVTDDVNQEIPLLEYMELGPAVVFVVKPMATKRVNSGDHAREDQLYVVGAVAVNHVTLSDEYDMDDSGIFPDVHPIDT